MLIRRADGVLEWAPDPPPIIVGAYTTEHVSTLANGATVRMVCHWGLILPAAQTLNRYPPIL